MTDSTIIFVLPLSKNKSIYLIFINTRDAYSLQENSNFTYKYFNDK